MDERTEKLLQLYAQQVSQLNHQVMMLTIEVERLQKELAKGESK